VEWIEHHPGLAAWLQAAGSVIAITAAFAVAYLQRHFDLADREQDRRIRAQGLALLILPELLALRGALERYVEREPAGPTSAPPETILRLADQMFVARKGWRRCASGARHFERRSRPSKSASYRE
jgi:hypothetical protein